MDASLNQPCRVKDEGVLRCKLLLRGKKPDFSKSADGTPRISTGEARLSVEGEGTARREREREEG